MRPVLDSLRVVTTLAAAASAACSPTYPACGDDGDCLAGELCVLGQCQQCRTDADCSAEGDVCRQGRCEAPPDRCATDVECGAGARCRDGRCVAVGPDAEAEPPPDTRSSCALRPVAFAFDDATLDDRARDALTENARCLRARGDVARLVLVGHADPRGTEEYNLALGERRAEAVRSYLRSLGVDEDRVEVQSMGEELASGEDEAGWSRDRRVDLTRLEEDGR